jgi:hypothetical protein
VITGVLTIFQVFSFAHNFDLFCQICYLCFFLYYLSFLCRVFK